MRLIPLGTSSGGVPPAGGAGSGYLVSQDDTHVLLDIGNGVLGNLTRHIPYGSLSAVFVSHLHADHLQDIYPLALYARHTKRRIPVYAPEGLRTLLYRWFHLFSQDPDAMVEALHLIEYKSWEVYTVGKLKLQPSPVEHNAPCHGVRVKGDGLLVYSADTKKSALLTEAAAGCDLLLAEATFRSDNAPPAALEHHMTAQQAAEVATEAGAKRLLLTHTRITEDLDALLADARAVFKGPVDLARVNEAYTVP
ncbi:MAG TPA: MBL fold metallo-hydrolase [Candidatus Thermoplasmatota archaeon]|nr:MBL fold metallo-hydrolase [Candidatus Thermoplasmatota archaeon]